MKWLLLLSFIVLSGHLFAQNDNRNLFQGFFSLGIRLDNKLKIYDMLESNSLPVYRNLGVPFGFIINTKAGKYYPEFGIEFDTRSKTQDTIYTKYGCLSFNLSILTGLLKDSKINLLIGPHYSLSLTNLVYYLGESTIDISSINSSKIPRCINLSCSKDFFGLKFRIDFSKLLEEDFFCDISGAVSISQKDWVSNISKVTNSPDEKIRRFECSLIYGL